MRDVTGPGDEARAVRGVWAEADRGTGRLALEERPAGAASPLGRTSPWMFVRLSRSFLADLMIVCVQWNNARWLMSVSGCVFLHFKHGAHLHCRQSFKTSIF